MDEKREREFLESIIVGTFGVIVLVGTWSWLRAHPILAVIVGLFVVVPAFYIIDNIVYWVSLRKQQGRRK